MKKSSQQDLNLRAHVIMCLLEVQHGKSLSSFLSRELNDVDPRDRALFHELLLGTLRHWYALKSISLPLLVKPLDNAKVETCLYLGIYQLLMTRVAPHAAISETVDATKQVGFETMSGVVNAILRRVSRETETFQQALAEAHGLPSWMFKRLRKDWPEQLPELFQNLKLSAPLTIRVNQRHIGRNEYLSELHELDIAAHACTVAEHGIVLDQNGHIPDLLGFDEGWFSVQDEHAQLAAQLLPDLNGKVVIDACAAPGGKTAHLLEKFDLKRLIALDQDEKRLERVYENLDRLQLSDLTQLDVLTADASTWQSPEAADCIVLDAPCTATGVMRRHPDIRLLRQTGDVAVTVELQAKILNNLWQQLKVDGVLLYITCSILKAENEQQMQSFFNAHPEAEEVKIKADWGIEQQYGRQCLPEPGRGDGFYYCLIRKTAV